MIVEKMENISNRARRTKCPPRNTTCPSLLRNHLHTLEAALQNPRPRPGRRRRRSCGITIATWTQCWVIFMLTLAVLPTTAEAVGRRTKFGRFARNEEIIFDHSTPPRLDLYRRGDGGDPSQTTQAKGSPQAAQSSTSSMAVDATRPKFSSPATAIASTATSLSSIVAPSGAATTSTSAAATSIISAPTGSSSIPKAFDGGLGQNFTEASCPLFLNSFLNNETFTDCMPFSLFLQTSMSFFAASKSFTSISKVLDSSCHVVVPACTSLMSSLVHDLKQDTNCGADYRLQNPIVQQAYNGLTAYAPLYQASCLRDTKTNHYCFADAVTNMSSPSDTYTYYLPLGMPLPSGTMLTCSDCLKQTMEIFDTAAANKSQPVSTDYTQAAQIINLGCGPGFVNQTIEKGTSSGSSLLPLRLGILLPVLITVAGFLQLV